MKPSTMISIGAFLAGLAVGLGAFGAHGLKQYLTTEQLSIWEVGVRYQMYHAIGMIVCGMFVSRLEEHQRRWGTVAGVLFLIGVLIFSGCLYGLALGGPRVLGAIVPIGGVAFIGGWLAFALASLKSTPRTL